MADSDDGIFPGPRPYDERSAHLFFGRTREIDDLVGKTFERLAILSADSGAGKTSLLAAGYIPRLRELRALRRTGSPVLLIRSWASGGASTASRRLLEGAKDAIRRLEEVSAHWHRIGELAASDSELRTRATAVALSVERDAELLMKRLAVIPEDAPVEAAWSSLCDACGGLVLVLDQFEEFMGSASQGADAERAAAAARAVAAIHESEKRVKILIALRSEFCRLLQRLLTPYVAQVDKRVIDLAALAPESIEHVLKGALSRGWSIAPGSSLAAFARTITQSCGGPFALDRSTAHTPRHDFETASFSLLEVQALLRRYERTRATNSSGRVLCESALAGLISELQGSQRAPRIAHASHTQTQRPGRAALEQWVFEHLDLVTQGDPQADERSSLDREGLTRWLLLPILPQLSSKGGFKQHLPEQRLLEDACNRVAPGALDPSRLATVLSSWMASKTDQLDLDRAGTATVFASGVGARLLGEPGAGRMPANPLVAACLRALRRTLEALVAEGILKSSGSGGEVSLELVHDGLGDFVKSWADLLPRDARTFLGCPVEIRGEQFRFDGLIGEEGRPLEIVGARWIGTSLRNAIFRNVRFVDCAMSGCYFGNCELDNVQFRGSDLSATIFDGARVTFAGETSGTRGRPEDQKDSIEVAMFGGCEMRSTAFKDCRLDGISFAGELYDIEKVAQLNERVPNDGLRRLRRLADLTCVSFEGCTIAPRRSVRFTGCILRFSLLKEFQIDGLDEGREAIRFERCDLMNAWIFDAGRDCVTIDERCRTIGLVSFTLPPEAWLDRAAYRGRADASRSSP